MTTALKRQLHGELRHNSYDDQFGLQSKMTIPRHEEARIIVSRDIRDRVKALAQKNHVNMATVVLLGTRALEKNATRKV